MTSFAVAGMDAPLMQDHRLWDYMLDSLQTSPEVKVHVSTAFAARPTERFCIEVVEADTDEVYGRVVSWPGGVAATDQTELLVERGCCWDVHSADHSDDGAPRDE
jgi:hypothetical protein